MQKLKQWLKQNRTFLIIFAALSAVLVFGIFPICSEDFISYDSSYQYALTQHSYSEIWRLIPEDYSPPLYSLLLKTFCVMFGHTLYVMRVFSLIPMIGMLILALFPFRRLFGGRASILSGIMLLSSSFVFYLMPEIRPTVLALFFMTGTAIYACDVWFNGKRGAYIGLTVFSVLGMYTHNVAMLGALGLYVLLMVYALLRQDKDKLRKVFISGIVSAVVYIPWLFVVIKQFSNVKEHYWVSSATALDGFGWLYKLSINNRPLHKSPIFLVLEIALAYVLIRNVRYGKAKDGKEIKQASSAFSKWTDKAKELCKDDKLRFLFFAVNAPLMVLGLFHNYVYNIITSRYVYILAGVYVMLLAVIMAQFKGRVFFAVFAAAIACNGWICADSIIDDIEKQDMSYAIDKIKEENPDGDVIFLDLHEFAIGMFSYYFPESTHYVCDYTFTVLRTFDVFTTTVIDVGAIENIWNYTDEFYMFLPNGAYNDIPYEQEDLFKYLDDNGYNYDMYVGCRQPYFYSRYNNIILKVWCDNESGGQTE